MLRSALLSKRPFRFYPLKQKSLSLLPNLFTLGNAFFGFCSLIFVARESLIAGAYAILLGGLMDMLDGRIARYSGNASALGLQLDSLCDAVSFCVAPAFLIYFWQLKHFGILGLFVSALFLLAGVLRLARFNITHEAQTVYFLGIPTTIAAITLVLLFLNLEHITLSRTHNWFILTVVALLSFLMISPIKFPTLKHLKKKWYAIGILATIAFLMIFGFIKVGLVTIACYFIYAFIENILLAISRSKKPPINPIAQKSN